MLWLQVLALYQFSILYNHTALPFLPPRRRPRRGSHERSQLHEWADTLTRKRRTLQITHSSDLRCHFLPLETVRTVLLVYERYRRKKERASVVLMDVDVAGAVFKWSTDPRRSILDPTSKTEASGQKRATSGYH
jgi:hypothetical protein